MFEACFLLTSKKYKTDMQSCFQRKNLRKFIANMPINIKQKANN